MRDRQTEKPFYGNIEERGYSSGLNWKKKIQTFKIQFNSIQISNFPDGMNKLFELN